MMTKYNYVLSLCVGLCLFFLSACAGPSAAAFNDEPESTPFVPPTAAQAISWPEEIPPPPTPWVTETEDADETGEVQDLTGYTVSRLTGLPIPEEIAVKRPIAVVTNNIFKALPQTGISHADLIYEVLAEANITRLVAIYQNPDAAKIGPVRSARDYFVDFALDYDAIFVHHGGSPSGYDRLQTLKINRLDGINLEGAYFWRDRTYPDWDPVHSGQMRPMEHSSYTGGDKIKEAIEKFGFRDKLYEDADFGFTFNAGIALSASDNAAATVIKVPFSKEYTRIFTYDPVTLLYTVSNPVGQQMDAETAQPLTVSNIIIQVANMRVIPGDEAGRRDVVTVGSGNGYVASAGAYQEIKWEKTSHTTPTHWTYADGSEMRLNAGKTWICVFQDNGTPVFEN